MQHFEYLIRSDLHDMAEDVARPFGSRERERQKAYTEVVAAELNKLGVLGWELVKAPDAPTNRSWIFKRPMA
ncbi:hypothetical protein LLG90_25515 [Aromatoleum toluclasticum]|uniref:hypothetical protein n=1 Tax=Aromatoleum toluclasticum TaxID=92003 RepID=UPI00036AA353|nr:hypothetical protein [Aromatoleum toluclasticum]MCC4118722.1 hypothetical protein [Aromatoleum toluclasticum]